MFKYNDGYFKYRAWFIKFDTFLHQQKVKFYSLVIGIRSNLKSHASGKGCRTAVPWPNTKTSRLKKHREQNQELKLWAITVANYQNEITNHKYVFEWLEKQVNCNL